MSKNFTVKKYTNDGSFTVPAGVFTIKVKVFRKISTNIVNFFRGFGLDFEGNAFGWGNNTAGALGDGTTTTRSSPVLLSGSRKYVQLISKYEGAHLLDELGDCYSFGNNDSGYIGDGTATAKSVPTMAVGSLKFKKIINNNSSFSLALAVDGKVYSWGDNPFGQLGVNATSNRSTPTLIAAPIACRDAFVASEVSYFLTFDNDLYCSGYNIDGQLPIGTTGNRSSPVIAIGGRKWRTCFINSSTQFALDLNGDAYAWGLNGDGQCGINTDTLYITSPTLVSGSHKFIKIAPSGLHVLGLKANGELYSWGSNGSGRAGLGSAPRTSTPTLISGGWKDCFVGTDCSFAINSSNDLYAWGANTGGKLGLNDTASRSSPVLVNTGIKYKNAFSLQNSSFFLDVNGNLYGTGDNGGTLGTGDATNKSSPAIVVGNRLWNMSSERIVIEKDIAVSPGSVLPIVIWNKNVLINSENICPSIGEIRVEISYQS